MTILGLVCSDISATLTQAIKATISNYTSIPIAKIVIKYPNCNSKHIDHSFDFEEDNTISLALAKADSIVVKISLFTTNTTEAASLETSLSTTPTDLQDDILDAINAANLNIPVTGVEIDNVDNSFVSAAAGSSVFLSLAIAVVGAIWWSFV